MRRLILVRHGKSVANEQKLVTGETSDPLSEGGIFQAKLLRTLVEREGISGDLYVTSQWLRAQETANIVWPNKDWIYDERVGETNAGTASSLTINSFLKSNPNFYSSHENKYPGGESHMDLNARVINWLHEMMHADFGTVILVGHSGPICCILQNALCVGMDLYPALIVHNASLSILECTQRPSKSWANIKCISMVPEARLHEFY